jgi:hypothetical protein
MRKRNTICARHRCTIGAYLILAAVAAGCSGDYSTVSSVPEAPPKVVTTAPGKKQPAPLVPRGPGQAKALQEAKKK